MREAIAATDHELKETEGHESDPQGCDTPCGDTYMKFIRLAILLIGLLPVLLGCFEASPREVMYY